MIHIAMLMLAIDVHSHIVTDEYLKYLADNDALMEDGYPLPTWDEQSHLAFMDSVGIERSVQPGVLTMYAVSDKENPCNITILETYASQQAYRSHIASEHVQKYKQGTLHMVDSLLLDDVTPLNPANQIINIIK